MKWLLIFAVLAGYMGSPLRLYADDSASPSTKAQSEASRMLAFVDVETTGLDPTYNEMIDAGIVLVDADGHVADTFFSRIMPEHPDRTHPKARQVNGFSVERWRREHSISPSRAVAEIDSFFRRHSGETEVVFIAYNAGFDLGFLGELFRAHQKQFSAYYDYVIDLPKLASRLGFGYSGADKLVKKLGIRDEPRHTRNEAWKHTGLTGAKLNLRIYRALLGQSDVEDDWNPGDNPTLGQKLIQSGTE